MPELAQLIHLSEAAERLGLSVSDLRIRIETGTITAGMLPTGEIVVSESELAGQKTAPLDEDINAQLRAIKREDFAHLMGQAITVSEAAKKYSRKYGAKIIRRTVSDWTERGYIKILKSGYRMELNEADVAYCAAVHVARKEIGIRAGTPLLTKDGHPNLIKHPALSRYRREQRQLEQR